ncbi:MAG: putative manganese-dependent inorganic diphosphatase [Atopobiaceae bacterium]|jgi:manganese-dependent inorganic pyrophosphatase|nr:putative manganese-dependent inorganic diphosphatase [Atopobiaceae bacterium]MCI2173048.1 putative manganese-dependent inorganic diphosphatase [Atopobiaceae bacterium]MCI2208141.1 putative manganese-dependent inorganic diphosphatase [Atopobiaceae bacterium]
MPEAIRKVNIIGHQHPDTDSICSAIAYAYLKNQTGEHIYEARRAGTVSRETAFVLKHFGFEEPQLITTVTPQIKDLEIQRQPGIDCEMSLYEAWSLMRDIKLDTLAVTDEENDLIGLIAIKDIANANMDIFSTEVLSASATKYANVVETLKGTMVLGDPEARIDRGHVRVGTSPEMMDGSIEPGDLLLVTNRPETQRFAVENGAGCLVICCDADVDADVLELARKRDCTVITTPHDTYATARLISMAMPVRARMLTEGILKFSVNTSVDDARKVMASSRHRYFPVLDEDGHYCGIVGGMGMLNAKKKHVILVDHNEQSQAVDGLDQAEIMEIIDHHRIGSIETSGPVWFRNEPVGCTSTIIFDIFGEKGVQIPPRIAGLMLSAILSDTLAFRSPTCTEKDRHAATELARICGEDIDAYADAMFDAGSDLTGRTAEEVFHSDFKVFSRGNVHFGVGQGSYMTEASRKAAEALVGPYLKDGAAEEELPMVLFMFTDVKTQTTEMLYYGEGADEVVSRAFGVDAHDGQATLPGVVSRKKQVIPPLMATMQEAQEE